MGPPAYPDRLRPGDPGAMSKDRFQFLELDVRSERPTTPPRVSPSRAARQRPSGVRVVEIIGSFGTGPGEFNCPAGLALDRESNLYVADALNHRVQRISPAGEVTVLGEPGKRMGQFTLPKAVAMDLAGCLYVVEQGNHRVQKFNPRGEWAHAFGSQGSSLGQFNSPCHLALDQFHNLYVADAGNRRVQIFTSGGSFLAALPRPNHHQGLVQLQRPSGVAVDDQGQVLIADTTAHLVYRCDRQGELLATIGCPGPAPGQLSEPWALALDGAGNLWVTELGNHRLQRFNPQGESDLTFTTQRGLPGRIISPSGLALDLGRGDLYLADTLNHRILRMVAATAA